MPLTTRTARKKRGVATPPLFQKQPHIALQLYLHRYFDIHDLQAMFPDVFHENGQTNKYIQRWRDAGFIKTRGAGRSEETNLHSTTKRLVDFLEEQYYPHTFVRTADDVVSTTLISHERLASAFQSYVYQRVQAHPDITTRQSVRRVGATPSTRFRYKAHGGEEKLYIPDWLHLFTRQSKGRVLPLFDVVEIDRGTMKKTPITTKIDKHWRWMEQNGRQQLLDLYAPYDSQQPFYRLLVVTTDDQRANHFRRLAMFYTVVALRDARIPLYITTTELLNKARSGAGDAIWYPHHFFQDDWRRELRMLDSFVAQVDFVEAKLKTFPRLYPLFPEPAAPTVAAS